MGPFRLYDFFSFVEKEKKNVAVAAFFESVMLYKTRKVFCSTLLPYDRIV